MPAAFLFLALLAQIDPETSTEAPTGFDGLTNGFTSQLEMDANKAVFGQREEPGIAFNHFSCTSCHFSPIDGGAARGIAELRVGTFAQGRFSGGRLVHVASTNADQQEHIATVENVRTRRVSTSTLGLGFVECIANATLQNNIAAQPANLRGTLVVVPVDEAPGQFRIGRFGWKAQKASLRDFAHGAGVDEIGEIADIFSDDVTAEADFMRATKFPPRDQNLINNPGVIRGDALFRQIGCAVCHTPTFTTAVAGTAINGGTFIVPAALAEKIIHPYSDFALHDIDTGDGIVQVGPQSTRNQIKTPMLAGLRTAPLLFHDGRAITRLECVLAHGGQAIPVINAFRRLAVNQQEDVLLFLLSL